LRAACCLVATPSVLGPHGQWLALAGTMMLFARKSHAARHFVRNHLICGQRPHAGDIFDSHHPLHIGCNNLI
jgi:hypothetical protein